MIRIVKSPRSTKKFRAIFEDNTFVDFGGAGYSDYTIHKDPKRMKRYLNRHRKREDWTRKGLKTAGFWSRWLLWSEPNFKQAIRTIENKFNIKINGPTRSISIGS
jgi:hypothetical protein